MSNRWALRMSAKLQRLSRSFTSEEKETHEPSGDTPIPKDAILIGTHAAGGAQHLPQSQLLVHSHFTGSTGSGKTCWAAGLIKQLMDAGIPVIVLDGKGDIHEIALDLLTHSLAESGSEAALKRVRTIDLFSDRYLPPLNLCARDESVPLDLQSYETANLILHTIEADAGIRQARLLHHLLALIIEQNGTLLDAQRVLTDPHLLAGWVERSSSERVRAYFSQEFSREPQVTRSGVIARLDALLRLPSWRAMLGQRQALDFRRFFDDGITLLTLGNSPLGCRDLRSFAGRFLFLRLARAVMSRPVMADIKPVVILIDEVQEFLSTEVAGEMERLLALSRSRKVFLALFHQQVTQLEKVSPTLPRILKTNCGLQALFRSSLEDARAFAHVLPTTGKVLRPDYQPGRPTLQEPYLSPSDEKQRLIESIPNLPARQFYLWQSGGGAARLLRSPDVPFDRWRKSAAAHPELRERVSQGCLAMPVSEMEPEESSVQPRKREAAEPKRLTLPPSAFDELG